MIEVARPVRVNGFTLIEILIVVVVLGILAAITVPRFSDASNQAENAAAHSQFNVLRGQMAMYWVREGTGAPLGEDITEVIDSLNSYGLLASPIVDSEPDVSGFQISGNHTLTWDAGVGVVRVFDSDGLPCDW
jgi:prepilin-type N-terminal cleavage/methylation domain-containing protein